MNSKVREDVLSIQPDHFIGINQVIYEYVFSAYLNNLNFEPYNNLSAIKDHIREEKQKNFLRGNVASYLKVELLEGYQYEHVYDVVANNFNKFQTDLIKHQLINELDNVEDLDELTSKLLSAEQKLQTIHISSYNTFDVEKAQSHLLASYSERGMKTFCEEWNWRLSGNEHIGMEWDSFHLITGATGSGKSCIAKELENKFTLYKEPVCYFNLEISDHQFLKRHVCSNSDFLTRYDCNKYVLEHNEKKYAEFAKWKEDLRTKIENGKLYLYDNTYYRFEKIIEIIKYLSSNKGVRIFIVDTINRIRMANKSDAEKYLYIGDITSTFEQIAHDYKSIIIGVAQENVAGETKGAKDTNEVANTITSVRRLPMGDCPRDEENNIIATTELVVAKARDGEVGRTRMYFDTDHFRYFQPNSIYHPLFQKRINAINILKKNNEDVFEGVTAKDLPF